MKKGFLAFFLILLFGLVSAYDCGRVSGSTWVWNSDGYVANGWNLSGTGLSCTSFGLAEYSSQCAVNVNGFSDYISLHAPAYVNSIWYPNPTFGTPQYSTRCQKMVYCDDDGEGHVFVCTKKDVACLNSDPNICACDVAANPIPTQSCGNCGTQELWCNFWFTARDVLGPCTGEGDCSSGDTLSQSCGTCMLGTQTKTCSSVCQWPTSWSTCTGDITCTSGQTQQDQSNCSACMAKTRTCVGSCWGAWSSCAPSGGFCSPSAQLFRYCQVGNNPVGGLQRGTCPSNSLISSVAWGSCVAIASVNTSCVSGGKVGLVDSPCCIRYDTCPSSGPFAGSILGIISTWLGNTCVQGVCSAGSIDINACGNCGEKRRVCDVNNQWGAWSACSDEGVCDPGDLSHVPQIFPDSEAALCHDCGVSIRECQSNCEWGAWSACDCEPSYETEVCGNCGEHSRGCTHAQDCNWSAWSTCSNEGVCAVGSQEPNGSCAGGLVQWWDCNSDCAWVLGDCLSAPPVVVPPTCAEIGFSVDFKNANSGGSKTLVNFEVSCVSASSINAISFRDIGGQVVSGRASASTPLPFACSQTPAMISAEIDTNIVGNYSATFSCANSNCDKTVYFTITGNNSNDSNRLIPDSNIFAVLVSLLAVSFILTRKSSKK
ncbi:MAG: hypothetical protein WC874_01115 [Candidatus Izemoplasmatales bacterium]